MSIGPSFAPSYVGPGTYTKVTYQNVPPTALPPFVTALIGRTSGDKPTTATLVRNAVASQILIVDTTTGVISISSTPDLDETMRRDRLTDDNTSIVTLDNTSVIVDGETFQQYFNGFDNDWVRTDVSAKTYIEWITDYGVKTVSTAPIFIGKAGVGSLPILLARAATDPLFATPATVVPVTIPDGVAIFRLSLTFAVNPGPCTAALLSVKGPGATTFSTPQSVLAGGEISILDNGTGGSSGLVRVRVDNAKFTLANFPNVGVLPVNYDNTVTLSTHGPRIGTATVPTDQRALGSKYDLSYQAVKTISDFVPQAFDSLAILQAIHGAVGLNTAVDFLSVGAYPYFNEGGQTVYTVPLKDKDIVGTTDGYDLDESTGVGYTAAVEDALVQLENIADVTLVIVLSPSEAIGAGNFRPGILNAVLSHVNRMSSTPSRKPRMAILGAVAGATNESIFSGTASAARSPRIVYLAPSTATLQLSGFSKIADGSTIAAALAGILSSGIDAGEPIMKKRFVSFVDIPDPFTLTQKNRLAGTYGLTIIEKVGGVPTIRDFLTTDVTNTLTANGKVTILEIDIRKSLQSTLDATVIGTRLVGQESLGEIRRMVQFVLERKRTAQIIKSGEIVNITIDPTVPDQVNVDVRVVPVFDTKWVYVNTVFQTS